MHFTARTVLIVLATVVLLAATVAVLQKPFQRMTRPSVMKDVNIINTSHVDIFFVVVRPNARVVIPTISVPSNQQMALHVYSGDSTSEYDHTEFIFVAWSADRVSRSLVLTGLEIDARNGRIEFSDIHSGGLR